MTIQRHFKLALTAGHTIPLVINANQYDSGEQWLFTLYNDGVRYTPSSGAIVGIKADRLGIINTGTVDANGLVVINETRQMTAAVGKNIFELLIDDQTHGTANFMVLVEPRPGDNADLSESDYSLFEEAIQGTSQAAIKAGVQEWMDENLTDPTDPIVDASLSLSGAAADAKKTGDEISALKSAIAQLESIPHTIKIAMDNLFSKVACGENDAENDYAVFHAWATEVTVTHISATFVPGDNLIFSTDSLDTLKQYLTVTAYYSDDTSAVVSNYGLSGTLTAGTSTITVTYLDNTTTFTVNVVEAVDVSPALSSYTNTSGVSHTIEGNSIRVYINTAKTYSGVQGNFTRESGYTYKLSFDATYVRGIGNVGFRNTVGSGIVKGAGTFTTSGHYEVVLTTDIADASSGALYIALFCTWGTAEQGDITYSNIKVIKYIAE